MQLPDCADCCWYCCKAEGGSIWRKKKLPEKNADWGDGTSAVDRSKITSALKSFVGAYNTYIEQTGKSSKSTVQKQNLSALKATAANSKLLAEVGISYDKKGNLTLDETKAQKASLSTIKSLFQGGGSYGDTIGDKATATYRLANSASYKTSGGTRYSSQGTYSTLGNTSMYAVGEAVNLFCSQFAVLPPAYNVPPGGECSVFCGGNHTVLL